MEQATKELEETVSKLEERVVALERLLLGDRLGALDSRRLEAPR
jgi:hypothetical protein